MAFSLIAMVSEDKFGRRDFLKRSAGGIAGIGAGILGSSALLSCNPNFYSQTQTDNVNKESSLEKGLSNEWEQIASLNTPRQHFGAVKMRIPGLKKGKIPAIKAVKRFDAKAAESNLYLY